MALSKSTGLPSTLLLVLAVTSTICSFRAHLVLFVSGVVVDGSKRPELSATRNASRDEQSAISPFNTRACGIADPNYEEHEFINMAREGQFPWLVSFQIKIASDSTSKNSNGVSANSSSQVPSNAKNNNRAKKYEDLHFCSGSFISDKWILSAAHCFVGETIVNYMKNDKLKAVAGSHKVSSRTPLNRNLTIDKIYYHSRFDPAMPLGFDIALVELAERVQFSLKRTRNEFGEQSSPFMNSICLPLTNKLYRSNETARLAGWGLSNANDASSMPSKLLTTDILISNQRVCVERYVSSLRSTRPREQKSKYNDFLCANYKNTRDACQSDSGGPLMQFVNRKAVVIGIVSYGIGCATKGVPGVYTRTSAYIKWIRDITTHGKAAKVTFKLIEPNRTVSSGG